MHTTTYHIEIKGNATDFGDVLRTTLEEGHTVNAVQNFDGTKHALLIFEIDTDEDTEKYLESILEEDDRVREYRAR